MNARKFFRLNVCMALAIAVANGVFAKGGYNEIPAFLFQQTLLDGKVSDATGKALPGVSIKVKGKSEGTATDSTGHFSVRAVPGDILEISAVGYTTREVTVTGAATIDIVLTATTTSLDEVVVVGYGTQKKSAITGAVSSVDVNRINNIPVTNVSNALAGRAAGVTVVNTSGLSGATSRISARQFWRAGLRYRWYY